MRSPTVSWLLVSTLSALALSREADAGPLRITTGILEDDQAFAPLEFEIRGMPETSIAVLRSVPDGRELPCQVSLREGTRVKIAWLADELKKGSENIWEVAVVGGDSAKPKPRVEVRPGRDDTIDVSIDGQLFTRLRHARDQAKPFFFPVMGPTGKMITRQYPMQVEVPGEDQDHPHQKSLWFTHGDVGDVDFWAEGPTKGKIRQTAVDALISGPVFGEIATRNEWLTPEGKKLLDDERSFVFWALPRNQVLLDFTVKLTAPKEAVVFGDTKEGSFGIRLAETMKETRTGVVLTSRGVKGTGGAWGKPAEWIDYTGLVEGDRVGVAIFDHPTSFRHPTTWHVRNYGLFAANPFGYGDFKYEGKKGDFTLEAGKSIEFRYRLYFHSGGAEEARPALVWNGFAKPPVLHPVP